MRSSGLHNAERLVRLIGYNYTMNYNPLKSKTNWAAAVLIFINVGNVLIPTLPPLWAAILTGIIGVLVVLFHTQTAVRAGAVN